MANLKKCQKNQQAHISKKTKGKKRETGIKNKLSKNWQREVK